MANKTRIRTARHVGSRSRRWLWGGLAGIIVVVIVAFAVVVSHSGSAVGGTALGTAVPGMALPSTAGQPISLADYRGRKVVLYFYEGST
jgi:cytochrome oxidase Cu insertion factor (SCO1/SenC/PrrC family)